ncbi:aminomethyltransferase family protein [Conexibacter woesei]|uniref:Uncharacterized protein n=1 Tax=Conexibacter woesei (strain DSM 14684 / CCUG 47730 / CIP 108061 / JCM 11494 / NBRC 100937 / ID131577) TaxID=469383 RepID=D3F6W9_CONWI|nr:hypothetical protein [Conexibacter woesei]ADB52767.1 hypothetical protein Cwoe_4353 [Conexibacter woesei DSM 14684]
MPDPTIHAGGGHIAAQVAACRTGAGLAVCRQAGVFELRGAAADVVFAARSLARGAAGRGAQGMRGWWQLVSAQQALVALDGDSAALAPRIDALSAWAPDVAVTTDWSRAAVVLAGPVAERVLAAALPRLPRSRRVVADGHVRVVVVPREHSASTRDALLAVGRELGAVAVSLEAVQLNGAAERALTRRTTSAASSTGVESTPTGEPIP